MICQCCCSHCPQVAKENGCFRFKHFMISSVSHLDNANQQSHCGCWAKTSLWAVRLSARKSFQQSALSLRTGDNLKETKGDHWPFLLQCCVASDRISLHQMVWVWSQLSSSICSSKVPSSKPLYSNYLLELWWEEAECYTLCFGQFLSMLKQNVLDTASSSWRL